MLRFAELKEEHERLNTEQIQSLEMDEGLAEDRHTLEQEGSIQEVPSELSEGLQPDLFGSRPAEKEDQGRSADETSHKNRSKRESRRMRELEQEHFSLELLKVRTTSVGGPLPGSSAPESDTPEPEDQQRASLQGSPTSHGSLERLGGEDMESESQEMAPQEYTHTLHDGLRDSNHNEKAPGQEEGPRATFYIASDQSPLHEPKFESPSKLYKDRRESVSRRPVVVLISMQKESPVEEQKLLAAQTHQGALETPAAASIASLTPIAGLEVTSAMKEPPGPDAHLEAPLSTRGPSPEVPTQEAPSPVLDTKPPKAQKKSSAQTVIVNMVEKPTNTVFSPPRRKLPFSK